MIRFLVLALLAVPFSVNAGTSDLAFVFDDSGQIRSVVRGSLPGTFSTSLNIGTVTASTPGNFAVTGSAAIPGPAGALPVSVVRTVSGAAAARAIVTQAAKGFTPVAIGLGAYELMQAYRVRASASGGLERDAGEDPGPQEYWETALRCGSSTFKGSGGSGSAAISSCHAKRSNGSDFISLGCLSGTGYMYPNGSQFSMTCEYRSAPAPNGYIATDNYSAYKSTKIQCKSQIDALTGQSYTPGQGADGKCITGRYSPVTVDDAAALLAAGMTVAAVKDYISKGSPVVPVPSVGSPVISGPATQSGTPVTSSTTTTAPNGAVTTVNNVSTPVYNYTYGGNTITIDNSVRTTTTTNVGGTTTTTETQADEPSDPQCKQFPNSVGCLQLGELPDTPITPVQKSVTVGQESVSLPSGCPGDVALPGGRVLSYASACAAAEDMAPLVIAAGVLSALLIAVAAIRGG